MRNFTSRLLTPTCTPGPASVNSWILDLSCGTTYWISWKQLVHLASRDLILFDISIVRPSFTCAVNWLQLSITSLMKDWTSLSWSVSSSFSRTNMDVSQCSLNRCRSLRSSYFLCIGRCRGVNPGGDGGDTSPPLFGQGGHLYSYPPHFLLRKI